MIIRVTIMAGHAVLTDRDGTMSMVVPAAYVERRMPASAGVAFFQAEMVSGVLELGDRARGWS